MEIARNIIGSNANDDVAFRPYINRPRDFVRAACTHFW